MFWKLQISVENSLQTPLTGAFDNNLTHVKVHIGWSKVTTFVKLARFLKWSFFLTKKKGDYSRVQKST